VLSGLILYKTLVHTSQKISVAIADQMLLVQDCDTISDYAQNDTKLANTLSGQNIRSLLWLYVLLPLLFKTVNRPAQFHRPVRLVLINSTAARISIGLWGFLQIS
jgi:hypothetical protein